MKARVFSHTIPGLETHSRLVHGVSPRCLEHENGEREPLRLGRDGGGYDVSADHKKAFLQSLGIGTEDLFLVNQVHGDRVFVIDRPEMTPAQVAKQSADALLTHLRDKPIGVMTADCVPVILYDVTNHAAGVVHAGRKGTQMGILAKTVDAMKVVYGTRPENLAVGLGPAIGPCCYEVDGPCVQPFRERFANWRQFVSSGAEPGKYWLDLLTANRLDAQGAGIPATAIHQHGECTACHTDRWFSYRREGQTGRMITLAMLR